MLRVPKAMDVSPPLMAEVGGVEEVVVEEGPDVVGDVREEGGVEVRRRKRRRSKSSDDGISWEHGSGRTRVKRGERRGMGWMMVVGGVLFVGITVLVVKVLSGGDDPVVVAKPVVGNQQKPVLAKDERRRDGELLAEMEPLCRKFLNTEGVEELLTMVHDRERVEPLVRAYYEAEGGRIDPPGMATFNPATGLVHGDGFVWMSISLGNFEDRAIAFVDGPEGLKVDWESFVGWSEMSWADFKEERPKEGKQFRALVRAVDYYNFEFADEDQWRSFSLRSPDGEHTLYGYTERGSLVEEKLLAGETGEEWSALLELRFPEGDSKSDQVIIETMLMEGWVRLQKPKE
jgi:hypothetical protein